MRPRRFINVTTLGDLIDRAATEHLRDALVFPDARLTYPELAQRSTDYARSLYALAVRAGDKVGILMPNQAEFVLAMVAAAKLGAVGVPVNGRFKAHELGYVIPHADIAVLLTARGPEEAVDFPGLIAEVAPTLPADGALRHVVDLSDSRPEFLRRDEFEALSGTVDSNTIAEQQIRVRVRDPALLMYTSGTSAMPKGCVIGHEAFDRAGAPVGEPRFEARGRLWCPLPLFHNGGLATLIGVPGDGSDVRPRRALRPGRRDRPARASPVTHAIPAFETIWLRVLDHPRFAQADLSALRIVLNAGTAARLRQLEARLPAVTKQVANYGCTEGSGHVSINLPSDPLELRINTGGHPLPRDGGPDRRPRHRRGARPGEVGEILFRGPCASAATTRRRRPLLRRSIPTAGSIPRTSAGSTRRADSPTSDVSRTCSRSGVRTSRPPRLRHC